MAPNKRVAKELNYTMRRGTTAWIKQDVKKLIVSKLVTRIGGGVVEGGPGTGVWGFFSMRTVCDCEFNLENLCDKGGLIFELKHLGDAAARSDS
ncbi:proteasome core particle subunit beta 2 [Puccinia graminis f. sp. tritici]|uniref:Proteasome core particle subunit beta 2 n=1 Tax=Puccinia graminis f. sp. tritici TaxID=56615 RepID=A0A5B0PMG0_PUCGR|nr:proteasome core particle subunit beta 2 [Puccinia graminis f. sp. tritici]